MYKAVCMCPWLSFCTVTFKKLASVSHPSVINLMFLWKELLKMFSLQFCMIPFHMNESNA